MVVKEGASKFEKIAYSALWAYSYFPKLDGSVDRNPTKDHRESKGTPQCQQEIRPYQRGKNQLQNHFYNNSFNKAFFPGRGDIWGVPSKIRPQRQVAPNLEYVS